MQVAKLTSTLKWRLSSSSPSAISIIIPTRHWRSFLTSSVSSLIRTSLIRILAYPNSQKQDYNIIHKHFNDIHIVIELSVIYFSMHFTYLNFSVIRNKNIFCLHKGVRISEDALYLQNRLPNLWGGNNYLKTLYLFHCLPFWRVIL